MKTLIKIIFFGAITVLLSIAAMAKENPRRTNPETPRNKDIVVYKADKKLVGGKVVILQDGSVIAEQVLQKRKLLIDFKSMQEGAYTIRITKGDAFDEFTFEKKP